MSRFFKRTNKLQIESKPRIESINPNVTDMLNRLALSTKPPAVPALVSTASSSASPNIVGPNEQMENDSTAKPPKVNDVGRAPPGRQRRNNWMSSTASIGQDEAYNQVCNFLKDEEVGMVGIYGMGGVGKTTLMKKIEREFLKPSHFEVIWVVVSKTANMDMIQEVIMGNLNLAFNKHDHSRAEKINAALQNNNVAILFDDIWKDLDLEELGIFGLDTRTFKLIFTTRSEDVCAKMQSEKLIKVEPLGWDESWALFKRSVSSKNDIESWDSSIVELAKEVARECKGLPLALKVIGGAMACRRRLEEWRHALATLRRYPADIPEAEEYLFTRLKFSFDSLSNRREKGCFLYTCFYPEDRVIEADMLIECWIGEGILTLNGSYQEALDEGMYIFGTLQAACLFETVQDSPLRMRIHDVIRDMGIWIANSHAITDKTESHRYSVWCERFKLPEEAICSNLTTLIIGSEVGNFNPFTSMSKLRVIKLRGVEFDEIPTSIGELTELRHLELIDTILERLPDEIRNLRKLQVMHVHNRFQDMNIDLPEAIGELTELRRLVCSTRNIPTEIGNLHKLEELVLDKSEIEELPKTVGQLTELRKLDVRGQKCRVGTLPVEVGNLKKLEELRKDSYLVEFPQVICQLVNLKKLFLKIQARVELPIGFGNLNKLEIFKLDERYSSFHCVELIPNDTFRKMHKLRELSLPIRNFKILPPSFFQGLTSLESLSFRYQGSDSDKDEIVEEADVASFLTQSSSLPLRTLIIERCPIKKFQVPPTSNDLCFPWLEELEIGDFYRLEKMQVMSQTALPSIRVLKITRCDSLKHISGLEHLQSLVELEIEECRKLEEVIQVAGDKTLSDHSPGICLPKLEKLGLWYLPQLKSICIDAISFPSLRYFRLVECPEPRVLPRGLVKENKAKLKDGSVVAIKKLTVKMETISKIKHRNLVPLLGYCKVGERLLVYEYMKYGSLEDVLHDRRKAGIRLNWPARRKIAVGAARGLAFMHHYCIPHIIHRDMKSRNVLLDENLEARVSDFGMASLMSDMDNHLSVSTLAGTPGYVPPEYYQSFRCSTKGDVYSYGVVLLELLTSRQPTDSSDFGDNNLVGWVKQHAKLKISDVFDPMLMKEDPALEVELLQHLKVACACLDDRPWRRPTMIQVMAMFKEIQAGNNGDSGNTDEGSNFGVVDISLKEEPELTSIKSENGNK